MKAFLACLRTSLPLLFLFAVGCGLHVKPYIRTSSSAPANTSIYHHRHINYEVPNQFRAFHDKNDEVTVVYKESRDFGIHLDVPRVGFDKSKGPAENVEHMLPILKKDLEREGRKEIKEVTQTFGNNAFYGFSYREENYHRETFDGVILVGKIYIISQIYFPLESDAKKYPGVRKSITSILEKMNHD